MNKRSRWILLLSVLLCLSMLFASCQPSDEPADSTDSSTTEAGGAGVTADTEAEAEEPIPLNEVVDYQALVNEWTKYVTYRAPKEDAKRTVRQLFTVPENVYEAESITEYFLDETSYYPFVLLTKSQEDIPGGVITTTYEVYHMKNASRVGEWTTTSDPDATSFSFSHYDGLVLEVRIHEQVFVVDDPNTDPPTGHNEWIYTYDYYDANGNLIVQDVAAVDAGADQSFTGLYQDRVTVGGQILVGRDGKLLASFPAGAELPVVDDVQVTATHNGLTYGWIYLSGRSQSFVVYDAQGYSRIQYTPYEGYDDYTETILSDGNVLMQYSLLCQDGEEDYTYEDPLTQEKYRYRTDLLNVTTGAVTELQTGFVIDWMMSSLQDGDIHMRLTDEFAAYQYAEIYKIVDGKQAVTPTFAILDGSLQIVAELPPILKNQIWLDIAVDGNTWVLAAKQGQDIVYYSLDPTTCKLSRYSSETGDYTMKNGLILDGFIYNSKMAEVFDLNGVRVLNYDLIENQEDGLTMVLVAMKDSEGAVTQKLLQIGANGTLSTVTLGDDNDKVSYEEVINGEWMFVVDAYDASGSYQGQKLYHTSGQLLVVGESVQVQRNDDNGYHPVLYAVAQDGTARTYFVFQ